MKKNVAKKKTPTGKTFEISASKTVTFDAEIELAKGVNLSDWEIEKRLRNGKLIIVGDKLLTKKTGKVKGTIKNSEEIDETYTDFEVSPDIEE